MHPEVKRAGINMTEDQLKEIEARVSAHPTKCADVMFIIHARADIPALCAALREAWKEIERAKEDRNRIAMETRREWMKKCEDVAAANDAEIERLRGALQTIRDANGCEMQQCGVWAKEALRTGAG